MICKGVLRGKKGEERVWRRDKGGMGRRGYAQVPGTVW